MGWLGFVTWLEFVGWPGCAGEPGCPGGATRPGREMCAAGFAVGDIIGAAEAVAVTTAPLDSAIATAETSTSRLRTIFI